MSENNERRRAVAAVAALVSFAGSGRVSRLRDLLTIAVALGALSLLLLVRQLKQFHSTSTNAVPAFRPARSSVNSECMLRQLLHQVEQRQLTADTENGRRKAVIRAPAAFIRDLGGLLSLDPHIELYQQNTTKGTSEKASEGVLQLCEVWAGSAAEAGNVASAREEAGEEAGKEAEGRCGGRPRRSAWTPALSEALLLELAPRAACRDVSGSSPAAASCFALPQHRESALRALSTHAPTEEWALKSAAGRPRRLSSARLLLLLQAQEFLVGQEWLIEKFIPNQLKIKGYPISVHYFVMLTSISPLRAYIFKEGIVNFRQSEEKGFRKMAGQRWVSSQLVQHVAASHGAAAAAGMSAQVDAALTGALLAATARLLRKELLVSPAHPLRSSLSQSVMRRLVCDHCFQLFEVDVMLNSSLHPFLMDVEPWAGLSGREGVLRRTVLTDAIAMLLANDSVAELVNRAMATASIRHNFGVVGLRCLPLHNLCLTPGDLETFLTARREFGRRGRFRRLYPSSKSANVARQLEDAMESSDAIAELNAAARLLRESGRHCTADIHWLVTEMVRFDGEDNPVSDEMGGCGDSGDLADDGEQESRVEKKRNVQRRYFQTGQSQDQPHLGLFPSTTMKIEDHEIMEYSSHSLENYFQNEEKRNDCTTDPGSSPYIAWLHTEPSLELEPPFSPLWLNYKVAVPYNQIVLRISASTQHCSTVVRFEHRHGPLWAINITIGLGDNNIRILSIDSTRDSVLITYQLTIRRQSLVLDEPPWDEAKPHMICGLRQECENLMAPNEPCGLQMERPRAPLAWSALRDHDAALPPCTAGDAYGRWLLPCRDCGVRESCIWSQARWQPYACSHPEVSRTRLALCLAGKKLLFIGDSTNRGMMHYILERLNGSLTACEKTHHIRLYEDLNNGQTTLGFAYYPQFWLSAPNRPVFEKTLYKLLLRSRPLQNNSNSVIVVGGVHWLATQHLHNLMRVLRREGLQGATLVVKTLGSGFHVPTEGVSFLGNAKQEKLLKHSLSLAAFAHHYNMEVIDTFNMTIARYKDFFQGKCACHFHKVNEQTGSKYHVEGTINAAYTDILLSKVCNVNKYVK